MYVCMYGCMHACVAVQLSALCMRLGTGLVCSPYNANFSEVS